MLPGFDLTNELMHVAANRIGLNFLSYTNAIRVEQEAAAQRNAFLLDQHAEHLADFLRGVGPDGQLESLQNRLGLDEAFVGELGVD